MNTSPGQDVDEVPQNNVDMNSVTTRSRHSSIQGPYRDATKGNTFPLCNQVFSVFDSVESYSRSLQSSGNGYPIFSVIGDLARPEEHIRRGVGIGDVGVLNPEGDFAFGFNIFRPPMDPIHRNRVPANFEPFPTPEPSYIVRVADQFRPGTVIASKGIAIDVVSESPLEFTLSTSAREGGVLILPDGASREDLKTSPELLEYVEKHVADWYRYLSDNAKSSVTWLPNGTAYLITGCDKAKSLCAVAIPNSNEHSGAEIRMQYNHRNPYPWVTKDMARTKTIPASESGDATHSVFLRGLRVSLSNHMWVRNMEHTPREDMPYYNILSTPILGLHARLIRRWERRFGDKSTYLEGHDEMPFHVSNIISQIILNESPNAEVAIVDDSVWIGQVDPLMGDGTAPEVLKLIVRVLLTHEIKTVRRTVTLVPKPINEPTQESAGYISRIFKNFSEFRARARAASKVKKVLEWR